MKRELPAARIERPSTFGTCCTTVTALLLFSACAKTADEWRAEIADADPYVRGMAAIGLCEEAPDHATDAFSELFKLIDSPELGLQTAAQRTLEHVGVHNVDGLLRLFTHWANMPESSRAAVLDALTAAGPVAIPSIVAATHDPGRSNPRALVAILVHMGDPAIDPLVELLERDSDPIVRTSAAWGLGELGPRAGRALPLLERAAEREDLMVSRVAIESLARVDRKGSRALPVLRRALSRPEEWMREAAGAALTRFHLDHGPDSPGSERDAAAAEILRIGDEALPALVDALDDANPETARRAEQYLLLVMARFELLRAWRLDGDPRSPLSPVDTTPLEAQTSVQVLTRNSIPGSEITRGLTAVALARRGKLSAPALPLLAYSLSDSSRSVRWCAGVAIFMIVIDGSGVLSSWRPGFFDR